MDEVGEAIAAAWERVMVRIADRPAELRKRLARLERPSLNKTPRARCLVVRANDLRIEGTVVDPGAAQRRHNVWLYGDDIERLCAPVEITPPGEPVEDVAARLGLTRMGLLQARLRGVFQTQHLHGRGRPEPLIYTPSLLDPNAELFGLSDPIWGWLGRELHTRIPVQTIARVPCFWAAGARYAEDVLDLDEGGESRRRGNPSRRLPPPEPDHLGWYKWKDGEYLGYDWRNPLAKAGYERYQRQLALARDGRNLRTFSRARLSLAPRTAGAA